MEFPDAATTFRLLLSLAAILVLCFLMVAAVYRMDLEQHYPFTDEEDFEEWEAEMRERAKQRHPSNQPFDWNR